MHKSESVLENEIHKILKNFKIKTDHKIKKKKKRKKIEFVILWILSFQLIKYRKVKKMKG